MNNTLVEERPTGAVDLGGSAQAASVGYPVGAIHFGPACSTLWEEQPSLRELYDQACAGLVRAECEAEELRASLAMVEAERDLLRVQVRAGEGLGMALVKTIDQLKEEKADLFVKLVNLQAGSRRATLDEIAESVRDKYEPEYEREEMDNG